MPDTEAAIVAAVGTVLVAAVDARAIGHSELARAAGYASIVRRGRPLTAKQAREVYRVLGRSMTRLAEAGIPMPPAPPELPEPVTMPVTAAVPAATDEKIQAAIMRDGRIAVRVPYRLRDTAKALPGGIPRKIDGSWFWVFTASPSTAATIVSALGPLGGQFSPKVTALAEQHSARAGASMLLVDGSPLPEIDTSPLLKPGFVLWDHQIRAVAYASEMAASLLAIPMGGGKTLSTITAINQAAMEKPQRVVIACPNKVRGVWPREVRKFSKLNWHIVNGTRESKRARSGYVSLNLPDRLAQAEECLFDCRCGAPVHAVVINYEAFAADPWGDWTPQKPIDVLVMDEIHRVKSYRLRTSKKRRTISGALGQWVNFTRKRIGLTGTPIPQSPLDMYGIFRSLDPGIFGGSWTMFKNRYAIPNPHVPEMTVGYQNVAEMSEKFHSITYRPVVDLKLPSVTDVTYEFDLEPKARKAYDSLDAELWADLSEFTRRHSGADWSELGDDGGEPDIAGESTVTPANVMVRLLRLQQFTGGTVIDDEQNRIRVSTAKAELLADVLEEVGCTKRTATHEPEPTVVFCRFRSDLDAVAEIAEKTGLVYAEVSGRRHDGLSRDAEMSPDADIVGVQIQSGGTGVDLTRARVMVWYSLGYSLSDYDQARKRLHRPGQTRPVLSVHLLARDTADMEVYDALETRRTVITNVIRAHGVDPARLGMREQQFDQEENGEVSGKGGVDLPFDSLMKSEALRMGAPVQSRKDSSA